MKHVKHMLVAVLTVFLAAVLAVPAFAADTNGTITVKKNYEGQTYKLYKIFDAETVDDRADDASGISYKLMSNKTDLKATVDGVEVDGAQWFTVDSKGNVTASTAQLDSSEFRAWVEAYGTKIGDDLTAASNDDTTIKWTALGEGYYYITTTTGSLVTVDSIKPNVEVNDKNTVPEVDKTITGASDITDEGKKALAQIGTDVEYTAVVTVGKGSKNLVFHDKMDEGLTFKGNNEVTVTADTELTGTWYTIKATPDTGDTLTITFVDGIAEGTKITITYKATINANALTKLENDAKVTYGDNNTSSQESKTEVYNAEISLIKYDGKETAATDDDITLAGAKFVLSKTGDVPNPDYDANAAAAATDETPYDVPETISGTVYYRLEGTTVSWVSDITQATVATSKADGTLDKKFTGLANGTYNLVETEAPEGFNKAADTPITIASGDYTLANLSQSTNIVNQKGTELPETGGMGTTILYTVGGIMVIAGIVMFLTKRRMASIEK